ncbi:MAG: SDR family oxidoreductase [Patescibacteria group bacterium]
MTVLITGASGDLGLAIAEKFASPGNTLILHSYRHPEAIRRFAKKHPRVKIVHINTDGSDEKRIKIALGNLRRIHGIGRIDAVVNNAGDLIERRPLSQLDWAFVQRTLDVNVKTAFLFTKYSYPYLRRGSSVIFISSMTAEAGKGDRSSAYGMAKGAILAWSKSLANELGRQGIRVNCIAPGYIRGNFHRRYTVKKVETKHAQRNPLGRVGRPEDVAYAVLALASQGEGYINGVTIDVNGGDYIR